jgi:hypothetical protein
MTEEAGRKIASEAGRRIAYRLRKAREWDEGTDICIYFRYYKEDVPYLLGLIKELSKLAKENERLRDMTLDELRARWPLTLAENKRRGILTKKERERLKRLEEP